MHLYLMMFLVWIDFLIKSRITKYCKRVKKRKKHWHLKQQNGKLRHKQYNSVHGYNLTPCIGTITRYCKRKKEISIDNSSDKIMEYTTWQCTWLHITHILKYSVTINNVYNIQHKRLFSMLISTFYKNNKR